MAKPITPEYLSRTGTEHGEQAAVFCWAAQNVRRFPVLRWMHALANGGGRTAIQGGLLKAEGVKAGVADINLPVPIGPYAGLYIEMKKADGVPSDVKPEQYEFGAFVTTHYQLWQVCFGWKEAVQQIESYLLQTACALSANQVKVHERLIAEYLYGKPDTEESAEADRAAS